MNLSIIIPTYNEAENISSLIQDIYKHVNDAEIVVVDDNSPDGTADIIQSLKKKFKNLKLLIRKEEKGLSSAVLAGFKIASGQNYCVMDADYSHPPEFIPRLRKELDDADMIFASRYVKGGGCENWPLLRRFISKFATILARQLTSVKDPMSGFFMLKKHII
ncbi:glycosyltransferase [Candidatus Woesearchaeota archaeon]|nr:glycosyltransferase [Candidatus Woesearchaeota archaeon]